MAAKNQNNDEEKQLAKNFEKLKLEDLESDKTEDELNIEMEK
jgi:hypothetical protein